MPKDDIRRSERNARRRGTGAGTASKSNNQKIQDVEIVKTRKSTLKSLKNLQASDEDEEMEYSPPQKARMTDGEIKKQQPKPQNSCSRLWKKAQS